MEKVTSRSITGNPERVRAKGVKAKELFEKTGKKPSKIVLVDDRKKNLETMFEMCQEEGIEFVPLEEALADPAYARGGSIVSDRFLVYQQKLAAADGKELPTVAPESANLMTRVFELATPLRPAKRGQMVQNLRKPSA